MQLTHATLYAIQFLLALSAEKKRRPIASHVVARTWGIPELFLKKLLGRLSKAGLLEIVMGPGGGCRLVRRLDQVSLLEVMEAIEGPLTGLSTVFTEPRNVGLDQRITKVAERANAAGRAELGKVKLSKLQQT
jgi:Rrf2 family protein